MEGAKNMRLFYGFALPDPIRQETARLALAAAQRIPGRYTDRDNHHITLAFLGDVPPERLSDAQAVLADGLRGMRAPRLTLGPCDFFGREQRAILILRVHSDPDLTALHDALCAALLKRGLPCDPGPFSPHITLARHAVIVPGLPGSFDVQPLSFRPPDVCLFLSARDADNVLRYTPIARVPFETCKQSPIL